MTSHKKPKKTLDKAAEAILFAHGEPMALSKLAKGLNVKISDIEPALDALRERLIRTSGLRLIQKDRTVQLVAAKEHAPLIQKLFKAQRKEELSRAALEVLAIIAYSGPINRANIEEIRGVNSAYIIRTLLMRGLIDQTHEQNTPSYALSFESMRTLGLSSPHDLPEWHKIQQEISQARQLTQPRE